MRYKTDARSEWNRRASHAKAKSVADIPFREDLIAYLPQNRDFTCLEVGALPGTFLAFLARHHGYRVVGLDFADAKHLFHETMKLNDIPEYDYIEADFLTFETSRCFDVVVSFGFIEHFENYEAVVERQCALVCEDGYVVIGMPNFRYFQFLVHWLVDRENLAIHNLECMDIAAIDALLVQLDFQNVHSGYRGGLEVWQEHPGNNVILRVVQSNLLRSLNLVGRFLPNSKYYSPYLLFVYRRSTGDDGGGHFPHST